MNHVLQNDPFFEKKIFLQFFLDSHGNSALEFTNESMSQDIELPYV